MKAKIKLWTSDGETVEGFPVKLVLSHQRITRRRTLTHSLETDWNPQQELPRDSHDDYEDLYPKLLDIKKKAGRMEFKQISDFDVAFDFLQGKTQVKVTDFYKFAESRIKFMKSIGRRGNANAYSDAVNALKEFAPVLSFPQITSEFLEMYKDYHKRKGNKNSTIKIYLVEIRAIYNSAVKAKLLENTKPFAGLFADIPVRKRRQRNRYLPESEFIKLETCNFNQLTYYRAVDLSLLQFYFCGLDLIDLYYLKNENIVGNRVILTRSKLGAKAYEFDVMIPAKAWRLLEKYRGTGEYVFPWRKDYTGYKTFRANHNRKLGLVKEALGIILAPKDDVLSSKVMRHTFATYAKFARVEEDLIRELMGHERNEIDTVYKDKYPEAERNAVQLKIIDVLAPEKPVRKVRVKLKVIRK